MFEKKISFLFLFLCLRALHILGFLRTFAQIVVNRAADEDGRHTSYDYTNHQRDDEFTNRSRYHNAQRNHYNQGRQRCHNGPVESLVQALVNIRFAAVFREHGLVFSDSVKDYDGIVDGISYQRKDSCDKRIINGKSEYCLEGDYHEYVVGYAYNGRQSVFP